MKEVQLDIIPSDTTLPDCLALMKRSGCAAVVTEHDGDLTLIMAEAITNAMNRAVEQKRDPAQVTVGTVRSASSFPSRLPPPFRSTATQLAANLSLDNSVLSQFRQMFDERDNRHVLIRTPELNQPTVRVITSSERFAQRLGGSVRICRCAGPIPDVHTFTHDQVEVEGQCNYSHGASLTCDEI